MLKKPRRHDDRTPPMAAIVDCGQEGNHDWTATRATRAMGVTTDDDNLHVRGILVPSIESQLREDGEAARLQGTSASLLVASTQYLVPSTQHPVPSTQYPASSTQRPQNWRGLAGSGGVCPVQNLKPEPPKD